MEFQKPVSDSLILLWSHERGELCFEDMTSSAPNYSLVKADGTAVSNTTAAQDVYGVYKDNRVYWGNAIFNDAYINWPSNADKAAIRAQLKKTFLIIK